MASMPNRNDRLVVALFEDLTLARQAQKSIDVWDKAEQSIKLGSTAVIYHGPDDKLHWERSGVKDWKKSAAVGGVVGLVLGAGVVAIAGVGAAIGGIDTKRLGVPKEDIETIGAELQGGKAALAVLCDDYEVLALTAELSRLSGTITTFNLPGEVVVQTEQTVQSRAETLGTQAPTTGLTSEYTPTTQPTAGGTDATSTAPPA
jgi:uncharacterized membrane protein